MKFLIINRPNGADHGDWDMASGKKAAGELQSALKSGEVEAAYVLLAGGHAYVVNADSSADLAKKVRYNPLYKSHSTEVIPIEDAMAYLAGYAEHLKSAHGM